VYISAIGRHLDSYLSGERLDPVDGTHHLGHIMASCAILLEAEASSKLVDDRPPIADHRPTYSAVEKAVAELGSKYRTLTPVHYNIDYKDPVK
jgi:hypothetical protein